MEYIRKYSTQIKNVCAIVGMVGIVKTALYMFVGMCKALYPSVNIIKRFAFFIRYQA